MASMQHCRVIAATSANQEDADLWRWFSGLMDEARIRWCRAHGSWLVTVDHKHVATEKDFDGAIRMAKTSLDKRDLTFPEEFTQLNCDL